MLNSILWYIMNNLKQDFGCFIRRYMIGKVLDMECMIFETHYKLKHIRCIDQMFGMKYNIAHMESIYSLESYRNVLRIYHRFQFINCRASNQNHNFLPLVED